MNINLDGGEIAIIKTLGFSGTQMTGRDLKSRVGGMEDAELLDCLQTLTAIGYVTCNRNLQRVEDLDKAMIGVNSGYSKELKEALDPRAKAAAAKPSKRVRRQ